LRLDVFFLPSEILPNAAQPDDIYIVVDVIRATTTLAVMLSRGAARVLVAETVEQAREAAQIIPGRLLCGERNVKRIPGFDYGNSPVQYSQLDLARKELILTTTNGTRAFYACPEGTIRLAGSFYNARATSPWSAQGSLATLRLMMLYAQAILLLRYNAKTQKFTCRRAPAPPLLSITALQQLR